MDRQVSRSDGLQQDLRVSDLREWQLWLLTLALLVLFGAGCIFAGYALVDLTAGNSGFGRAAYRLLVGLAVLIGLFCVHVLQARYSVSRVKLFLNEMNGMATSNLEIEDCLAEIVKGLAATYRSPLCRFFILRHADHAVELVSSHGATTKPATGYAHALDELVHFSHVGKTERLKLLSAEDLGALPADSPERYLLTGGISGINSILILPVRSEGRISGYLVLGRRRAWWQREYSGEEISLAMLLASHAGTVIKDAIRRRSAIQDPLTQLYNRRHFDKRIREEIHRASRSDQRLAILLCDLDGFKEINDTRGHQVGDNVLKLAATVIRSATRGTDLHFRWGGDEMIIVLTNTSADGVLTVAERVRGAFLRLAREQRINVDLSIGVALYPEHGRDQDELIRVADLAMYVAKHSGDKVHVGIANYELGEHCVNFAYQPIYHTRSREILGHEVFVRDPDGRLSPPELFKRYRAVGQLERLKRLIVELQLRKAREEGLRCVFVNADLRFLRATNPIKRPPDLEVVVEIADRDFQNGKEADLLALERWRREGYRLAVACLGPGYASLSIVEQLHPEFIKVAPLTVQRAAVSTRHLEFLRYVLKAAQSVTSARVVAEGIETATELEAARTLGVSFVQGFLLGRPVESSAAIDSKWPAEPGEADPLVEAMEMPRS